MGIHTITVESILEDISYIYNPLHKVAEPINSIISAFDMNPTRFLIQYHLQEGVDFEPSLVIKVEDTILNNQFEIQVLVDIVYNHTMVCGFYFKVNGETYSGSEYEDILYLNSVLLELNKCHKIRNNSVTIKDKLMDQYNKGGTV